MAFPHSHSSSESPVPLGGEGTDGAAELGGKKPDILVVDDSPISRQLLVFCLDALGYSCEVAASGREAIERVAEKVPDLILMDVYMTEMSGIDACQRIRAMLAAGRTEMPQPCIVAVSGEHPQTGADVCYAAGMDAYLFKPFKLHELAEVVSSVSGTGDRVLSAATTSRAKDLARRPLLDRDLYLSLNELEQKTKMHLLDRLATKMFQEVAEQVVRMEEALVERAWEELQASAHIVKGATAMMGASRMACCARLIHLAAKQQRSERTARLLDMLQRETEDLRRWLSYRT
jgi:CheY-like chemotaxis protein/HPt (histidine-containing phosphotransfer) domain-containing protein